MKKFGKVLAVFALAIILLGGCTLKEEFNFKIKEDKHVELGLVMAYDQEMIDGLITMSDSSVKKEDITDEMRWKYLDDQNKEDEENNKAPIDGATVTKYSQDGWYGYVYSKDIGLIDDLSTEDKNASKIDINSDNLDKAKMFIKDGDKYKSNMFIDKTSSDYKQMDSYKSYGAVFNVYLTVDLPNKAISNNATEVTNDGKTLKWNLLEADNIDFEFEFKKSSSKTLITIIAIVVVVIILLIALVVVIIVVATSGKKKAEAPAATTEEKK